MKKGEKCIFTVSEDMFNGKLKKGHRYIGKYWLPTLVCYRNWHVPVATVEPIKKPTVKKEKAPTASDYKNLGDVLFETSVRYRDNFTSVISGEKFPEFTWNELQAGHGVSRKQWATRHNPLNCHAITSGQNFHMSLGTTTTIAKYWAYVAKKYGQDVVDDLINGTHPSPKLSISYLKEDCKNQYAFLIKCLEKWNQNTKNKRLADEVLKIRCEKFPKTKAQGILNAFSIIKGELDG